MTADEDDLSAAEADVLECILDEQRVNTQLISERTTLSFAEIETALEQLISEGLVERVTEDLYEIDEGSRGQLRDAARYQGIPDPNPDTQTAPIDPTDVEEEDEE